MTSNAQFLLRLSTCHERWALSELNTCIVWWLESSFWRGTYFSFLTGSASCCSPLTAVMGWSYDWGFWQWFCLAFWVLFYEYHQQLSQLEIPISLPPFPQSSFLYSWLILYNQVLDLDLESILMTIIFFLKLSVENLSPHYDFNNGYFKCIFNQLWCVFL